MKATRYVREEVDPHECDGFSILATEEIIVAPHTPNILERLKKLWIKP